jgi:hypothetical protein
MAQGGLCLRVQDRMTMATTTPIENFDTMGTLLHPSSRKFFRHWEAARAERACPNRETFELAPIWDLVPNMFILERDHLNSTFRYRLAGSRIDQVYRRSLTGEDVLAGWDEFERGVVYRSLNFTATALQPGSLRIRLNTADRQVVGIEIVTVPVEARNSTQIQIWGAIFPFCDLERMTYQGITSQELVANRLIWTEHLRPEDVRNMANTTTQRPFQVIQGGRA